MTEDAKNTMLALKKAFSQKAPRVRTIDVRGKKVIVEDADNYRHIRKEY